jgi:hypothetical protein
MFSDYANRTGDPEFENNVKGSCSRAKAHEVFAWFLTRKCGWQNFRFGSRKAGLFNKLPVPVTARVRVEPPGTQTGLKWRMALVARKYCPTRALGLHMARC